MNAGAYGSETKDVLLSATVLTPEGQIKRIPAEELELGYRTSCIPGNGYVVLEAEYALKARRARGHKGPDGRAFRKRREKQPLEYPSAGSTFKRPQGHFAGQLIQEAGLKGFTLGELPCQKSTRALSSTRTGPRRRRSTDSAWR